MPIEAESMTTLYLVRHGETDWNREGRIQGHQDPPLNESGRAQARALAQRLADVPFDCAYSSDLQRALETARILVEARSVPLVVHSSLRERCLGRWEGQRIGEVAVADPAAWEAWLKRPYDEAPHGGESEAQLERRAVDLLATIVRAHPGRTILVVSHGGTIRAALRALVGHEPHYTPNCGAYRIQLAGATVALEEIIEGG